MVVVVVGVLVVLAVVIVLVVVVVWELRLLWLLWLFVVVVVVTVVVVVFVAAAGVGAAIVVVAAAGVAAVLVVVAAAAVVGGGGGGCQVAVYCGSLASCPCSKSYTASCFRFKAGKESRAQGPCFSQKRTMAQRPSGKVSQWPWRKRRSRAGAKRFTLVTFYFGSPRSRRPAQRDLGAKLTTATRVCCPAW